MTCRAYQPTTAAGSTQADEIRGKAKMDSVCRRRSSLKSPGSGNPIEFWDARPLIEGAWHPPATARRQSSWPFKSADSSQEHLKNGSHLPNAPEALDKRTNLSSGRRIARVLHAAGFRSKSKSGGSMSKGPSPCRSPCCFRPQRSQAVSSGRTVPTDELRESTLPQRRYHSYQPLHSGDSTRNTESDWPQCERGKAPPVRSRTNGSGVAMRYLDLGLAPNTRAEKRHHRPYQKPPAATSAPMIRSTQAVTRSHPPTTDTAANSPIPN